jgi:hypothetical protein
MNTQPRPADRVVSDTGLYCSVCRKPASSWDGTTGWYVEGDQERPFWSTGCCQGEYVDDDGRVRLMLPPSAEDY